MGEHGQVVPAREGIVALLGLVLTRGAQGRSLPQRRESLAARWS
jgi:hypothetical protein